VASIAQRFSRRSHFDFPLQSSLQQGQVLLTGSCSIERFTRLLLKHSGCAVLSRGCVDTTAAYHARTTAPTLSKSVLEHLHANQQYSAMLQPNTVRPLAGRALQQARGAETAYTGSKAQCLPSVLNSIADMSANHTQMILSGAMSSPPLD